MARSSAVLLLFVALAACTAFASRAGPEEFFASSDIVSGFRTGARDVVNLWREANREKESCRAYFAVKFIVPPSESEGFEKQWLRLEKDVVKEDEQMEVFDLKKTKSDNTIYFSYGEWQSHKGVHGHFASDSFEKFADWVDEHGIKWELRLLKSKSSDLDREQQGRRNEGLERKRGLAHVLIQYFVPPGEGESFIDAWLDTAKDTIKEKSNRIYSLRKVATDNTQFWGYGTWDSTEDYFEHFESRHVGRLIDYTQEKNIIWFIQPLLKIGNEPE